MKFPAISLQPDEPHAIGPDLTPNSPSISLALFVFRGFFGGDFFSR
jgi:hypothetical protein